MVDFAGHLPFDFEYARTSLVTSALPGTHSHGASVTAAFDLPTPSPGAWTNREPITILHRALGGSWSRSYFDDYYDRMWLIPTTVDFGALSEDSDATMLLWNAWLTPIGITSITETDLDNVTVVGPSSAHTFAPLSVTTYTIHALYVGNPTFDGFATFAFDNGESRKLTITGIRAFLWDTPFWPNWRDPVKISYEFSTEIIVSRSGLEQRRAMRQTPRKSFEFSAKALDTPSKQSQRQFRRFIDRSMNKTAIMPEFPRRVAVTAAPVTGDAAIAVASIPDWLVADELVVLSDGDGATLYRVMGIDGRSVQLAQTLKRDWSADAKVLAGVPGRLPDSLQTQARASFVSEISMRFTSYPGQEPPEAFDAGTAGLIFDGREVMTWRPNWAVDPTIELQWPVEEVDAGFGVVEEYRVIQFPARMVKAQFWAQSLDEAEAFRQFHQRMRGKQGEFWLPSFENDLVLREIAYAGTNRIRLVGTEHFYTYNDSLAYKAILVRMTDGTFHAHKIVSVFIVDDLVGTDTVIEFDANIAENIGADDTSTIDWLLLARLASDIMTFAWQTVSFATVEMTFQTLEYSGAE